jgi:CheY-like chemotaxis protein
MDSKICILVLDDDPHMTRTLSDILALNGYRVVEAWSAQEALDLVAAQEFDCVLTDVRMPGADGVEFYRQARRERPGLPVILMTAYAADEIIQQGLAEGVIGVLDKPINIALLLGFLAALTRQRGVVIVDDDPEFCRTLGDILRRRGFSARPFSDPHTAIETIVDEAQVILLDMKLNGITGLDLLRQIRARCPSLPVLLITAYRREMVENIQAGLKISAAECLDKPLHIPDLLEKLLLFQLQRLRQALSEQRAAL